ncbi:hypothetical protein Y032_0139g2110 [Ancylostoma ceylanicum]|uniref:Uncharacterized protein n=1 Tax=Ancylostoma ceylanicum TaxID=53326 RepID=A0A016T4J7_9BILA|nr:hypothetical protein Y032_0139g2110 [Ancylostoma ceylanicum]
MGISDINFDNFDNVAVRIFQELAYESKLNHLAQRILSEVELRAMHACRDMSASSQKLGRTTKRTSRKPLKTW